MASMRDIFECDGPEPIETALFMHSFEDTDDAVGFVDSYRLRLQRGMTPAEALAEASEHYGIPEEQLIFWLSTGQSQAQPSS